MTLIKAWMVRSLAPDNCSVPASLGHYWRHCWSWHDTPWYHCCCCWWWWCSWWHDTHNWGHNTDIITDSQTILLCFNHQTSREREFKLNIVIETLFSMIMSVEDGWWLSHSVWEIIIRTCGLGVVSTHSSIRSTDKYIPGRDEFTGPFTTFSILSTKN